MDGFEGYLGGEDARSSGKLDTGDVRNKGHQLISLFLARVITVTVHRGRKGWGADYEFSSGHTELPLRQPFLLASKTLLLKPFSFFLKHILGLV